VEAIPPTGGIGSRAAMAQDQDDQGVAGGGGGAETPHSSAVDRHDKSERLQVVLAVLLGAAALLTAWAAYQGELYSGDSVILLNQSVQSSDRASQSYSAGQTQFVQDVNLFTQFAVASAEDRGDTAQYVKDALMRPALKKQVEWWADTPDDVISPFVKDNPHFVDAGRERGLKLDAKAAAEFKRARALDDTGDKYVLYTVILAASLFLYGIASVATSRKVLFASMGVGAVLFLFAAVNIISTAADAPKLL
jgi:hypothetical protein